MGWKIARDEDDDAYDNTEEKGIQAFEVMDLLPDLDPTDSEVPFYDLAEALLKQALESGEYIAIPCHGKQYKQLVVVGVDAGCVYTTGGYVFEIGDINRLEVAG